MCREVAGDVELPGGLLLDEEHVLAFHVFPQEGERVVYLGYLMLVSRRHVAGHEDLDDVEAAAVGRGLTHLARALRDVAGADHVFVVRIGTGVPHLHIHLVPRYPETPRDVPWNKVDEWPGAKRGGAEEIAALVGRLRDDLHAK